MLNMKRQREPLHIFLILNYEEAYSSCIADKIKETDERLSYLFADNDKNLSHGHYYYLLDAFGRDIRRMVKLIYDFDSYDFRFYSYDLCDRFSLMMTTDSIESKDFPKTNGYSWYFKENVERCLHRIKTLMCIVWFMIMLVFWGIMHIKTYTKEGLVIKKGLFSKQTYVIFHDHVKLIKYHHSGSDRKCELPSVKFGKPVTEIGGSTFEGISEIKLPAYLFPLEKLVLGRFVETFEPGCFANYSFEVSCHDRADLQSIPEYAFQRDESL